MEQFTSPLRQKFTLNPKACFLVGIRLKELLNALDISIPPTIPSKVVNTAFFFLHVPHCNFSEVCTPPDTFQRLCTEMFTHYPGYTVVSRMGLW